MSNQICAKGGDTGFKKWPTKIKLILPNSKVKGEKKNHYYLRSEFPYPHNDVHEDVQHHGPLLFLKLKGNKNVVSKRTKTKRKKM